MAATAAPCAIENRCCYRATIVVIQPGIGRGLEHVVEHDLHRPRLEEVGRGGTAHAHERHRHRLPAGRRRSTTRSPLGSSRSLPSRQAATARPPCRHRLGVAVGIGRLHRFAWKSTQGSGHEGRPPRLRVSRVGGAEPCRNRWLEGVRRKCAEGGRLLGLKRRHSAARSRMILHHLCQMNLIVEPDDGIGRDPRAINKAKTGVDIGGIFRLDRGESPRRSARRSHAACPCAPSSPTRIAVATGGCSRLEQDLLKTGASVRRTWDDDLRRYHNKIMIIDRATLYVVLGLQLHRPRRRQEPELRPDDQEPRIGEGGDQAVRGRLAAPAVPYLASEGFRRESRERARAASHLSPGARKGARRSTTPSPPTLR